MLLKKNKALVNKSNNAMENAGILVKISFDKMLKVMTYLSQVS